MRKFLISILLASAAASPALAQDQDGHGRWHREQAQSDHQQAKEDRQQVREERGDGGGNVERMQQRAVPQFVAPQQVEREQRGGGNFERMQQRPAPQFVAPQQVEREQRGGFDRPRYERMNNPPPQPVVEQTDAAPRQMFERRGRWNGNDRQARSEEPAVMQRSQMGQEGRWVRPGGDLRQSDRPLPNVMRTRNPLIVSETPREGTQPPLRVDRRPGMVQWNTNWRYNDRYDWRRWRERHNSWFHVGIYYDPFGWSYQPYEIGWRLWPSYYSSRYWIEDPWMYRLPYAPPGYVWVRYWDDALLVDTWSGEVVDVIHGFFW